MRGARKGAFCGVCGLIGRVNVQMRFAVIMNLPLQQKSKLGTGTSQASAGNSSSLAGRPGDNITQVNQVNNTFCLLVATGTLLSLIGVDFQEIFYL